MSAKGMTILVVTGLTALGAVVKLSGQATQESRLVFAAVYSKGSAWVDDQSAFQHPAIRQHIAHFESLGDRLIGAAPFVLDPADRAVGMVLLIARDEAAARAWAAADPAVIAKVMDARVYQWRVRVVRAFQQ